MGRTEPSMSMPQRCALPERTHLDRRFTGESFFTDCYRVPLKREDASVIDIFFAVFGHHPAWLKAMLVARHRVGSWFGLAAAGNAELLQPRRKASYLVGDHVGAWPVFFLSEDELIAGRDNKHLDFRVSIRKSGTGEAAHAVVSTVCRTHNRFGRAYLRVIAPFHQWGVQRLLGAAARAGRL